MNQDVHGITPGEIPSIPARAATVAAVVALAFGLVVGNLNTAQWLTFNVMPFLTDMPRFTWDALMALEWPFWSVRGTLLDTATSVAPLCLSAIFVYLIGRRRLNSPMARGHEAGRIWWVTIFSGAIGGLAQVLTWLTMPQYSIAFTESGPGWWQIAYAAGWGAIAGIPAGIAARMVVKRSVPPSPAMP